MNKSDLFLKEFKESFGDFSHACEVIGVTRWQVLKLAKRSAAFQIKFWEVCEGFVDRAESTLLKNAIVNGGAELFKYLDAKGESRGYGRIKQVECSNDNMFPGIPKPEEKDPRLEFKDKVKVMSNAKIRSNLKLLKDLRM